MATITPLPSPPSRGEPTTFSAKTDAFLGALPTFITETNAVAAAAEADAATATAGAALAQGAANSLNAVANVPKWISGTTYALGDCVWSPANLYTYRRSVAGAGATDPSADTGNWTRVSPSQGVGSSVETTSAVDVTISNNGVRVHNINMSATGKSVFLPDATTITDFGAMWVIRAAGNTMSVRDSAGSLLMQLTNGQSGIFFVTNVSAAAGTWVGRMLPSAGTDGATGPVTDIETGFTAAYHSVTFLTATKALVCYSGVSTYAYAVTVDVSGNIPVMGTPLQINSAAITNISVSRLTDTTAICVYATSATKLQAVVLTAGTSTVTKGNIVATVDKSASGSCTVAALTSTKAIAVFSNITTGYTASVILDIVAGDPSAGTTAVIDSTNQATNNYCSVARLTDTKAIATFIGASSYCQSVILDVSSSNITPGNVAACNTTVSAYTQVRALSATQAICSYSATNGYCQVLDISGSTITPATAVNVAGVTAHRTALSIVDSATAYAVYSVSTTNWSYSQLNIASSVITEGTPVVLQAVSSSYSFGGYLLSAVGGTTSHKALFICRGNGNNLQGVILERPIAI